MIDEERDVTEELYTEMPGFTGCADALELPDIVHGGEA